MSAALLALDHLHRLNWGFFSISYFITHLSISLIHESVQTAIHNLNKRYLHTVTHSHQRERDCTSAYVVERCSLLLYTRLRPFMPGTPDYLK